MRILIVGYGEIGKAVHKHFSRFNDMQWQDVNAGTATHGRYDILHTCIPYSEDFVKTMQGYIDQYKPIFTISHSTTPIGTHRLINRPVIHAPVRGRHKNLAKALGEYQMYVSEDYIQAGLYYLMDCEVPIVVCQKHETTEAAKLLELMQYGVNIEFARYAKTVCDTFDLDYDEVVKDYGISHNVTIAKIDGRNLTKPILEPPKGKIGGHCVIPGMEILERQIPSELNQAVLRVNKDMESMQRLHIS